MTQATIRQSTAQVTETVIGGPGTANRLYICTGTAEAAGAWPPDSWTFLVGPSFQHNQYQRSTGTASISGWTVNLPPQDPNTPMGYNFSLGVQSVDADWDDESGQVQVQVDLTGYGASIQAVNYSVLIVAQM